MTTDIELLSREAAETFLFNEAELIDTWRLAEWAELFTADGEYLIPPLDAPDGEPGSLLMNVFKWLKRHDQPWFTLMADVAQEGAAKDIASWPALQSHSVAQNRELDVKASGALVLYPNDARNLFSSDDQYFYRNNRGQIWVQLAHLQPGQPCNDTLTP